MQLTALPKAPAEVRQLIRTGEVNETTAGMAPGHVQANLVVLPTDMAFEFMLFCQRNPKPCPLLEVTEPGDYRPRRLAPDADLRFDIPRYRVYRYGEVEAEVTDIDAYWRDDLVAFLLGCSFSFESALLRAGIGMRHIDCGSTVPMYVTNIQTEPAGSLSGPMVVSMRPVVRDHVVRATQVTSRFPAVHGAPVHIGDPGAIGIRDVGSPDLGEPTEIRDGEVPVFWACGVTPQAVAMNSKPPFMITHSPGYMFITDAVDEDYAVF